MFERLGVESPGLQTCIMVTLSHARDTGSAACDRAGSVGKTARQAGRPGSGIGHPCPDQAADDAAWRSTNRPVGRVLRMGGPPVDNVAIDEEGQITLVRLVGFSVVIGIGLGYLCFRRVTVTLMIFIVGGVSAIASLSIVWWTGSSVDAILMSMPSLVYVLGLSGAVHIVNYYREAVHEHGLVGAPKRALGTVFMPCTLAAFTTALGLLSLYQSNIFPIRKFGLFSAIGVMATLALLFTYLPSALQLWPPGYERSNGQRLGNRPAAEDPRVLASGRRLGRRPPSGGSPPVSWLVLIVVGFGVAS